MKRKKESEVMKKAEIEIKNDTVYELLKAIEQLNPDPNYTVYVSFVDFLYAVSEIAGDIDPDGGITVESRDNRFSDTEVMIVKDFVKRLQEMPLCERISLSAASNIDPELDMQMEEPMNIIGIAKSDICKDLYIMAGQ